MGPDRLTCEGDSSFVTYEYGGDPTFTRLLTNWSEELGRPWVGRERRTIWFLREDGTAHAALTWARVRQAENGREWFVDGYEQCHDAATWRGVRAEATPVELEVGHCWVEPVTVAGRTWDVIREDQFGWGGRIPRGIARDRSNAAIQPRGSLSFAGDVAIYVDAGGRHLTLVPEGDSWGLVWRGCK